jgi:hypothetical protein
VSIPDKIGIESRITQYLPAGEPSGTTEEGSGHRVGKVRARFRIENGNNLFPEGEAVDVKIVAQVHDREYVEKFGRTPEEGPIAEGDEVLRSARTAWSVVDLPLPPAPFARHPVVAKVYSNDARYRKLFDPSNCYVGIIEYGYFVRMRRSDLESIYSGVGNPAAEGEIRKYVRGGAVIADEDGGLLRASEVDGRLHLEPFLP